MPEISRADKTIAGAGAALSSWKEIAAFLGVDIRTCQRWEMSFGLPVHRIKDSVRSRVIAYPEEIETWKRTAFQTKNGAVPIERPKEGNGIPADSSEPKSTGRARSDETGRRFKSKPAAWIVFVLVAAAAILWAFIPLDRNPADFRIKGSILVICNKHGRSLSRFDTKIPNLREESFYRDRFPEKKVVIVDGRESMAFPFIFFHDHDGDGRNEVLFAPQTADDKGSGTLLLIDNRGTLLWEFECGTVPLVADKRYPPGFVINILEIRDVVGDEKPEIVVGSHAFLEAPTQLVVLDFKKRVLGEYWNFGQLADYKVVDIGRDGRKDIVAVGTNNEYDQGCFIVLDPENMKGTSPQSPKCEFAGMPEGTARFYLRFAPTEIDPIHFSRGINSLITIIGKTNIRVETGKSLIYYDFEDTLDPPQITLTDALSHAYREALAKNQIVHPLDKTALHQKLTEGVLYFDGQSRTWVNRRAMAHEGPVL